jgi:UDP-galactopyranose mutase
MLKSLLVFSHLRWNFVFQRPQHLMERLAQHWQILFFEEPVRSADCWLERTSPMRGITVCTPHTPIAAPGFHDDQLPSLELLTESLVHTELEEPYGVWFYSPMALPLMETLNPAVVVYDCMDELSAFQNAPRQIRQREGALLKRADIVFTGGPALYEAKRTRHPHVHCFPSSVDLKHFRKAGVEVFDHPLQARIPRPRIGFYGVIDERIDLELLRESAEARPDWQFVMVGPCAKIDPSILPQRANIHYLGQQPYEALPAFLAGWDLCMQPFALNESTRFISPTKTLEYMAAGRPVVSTPIGDVVKPYGDVVFIAADSAAFVAACEQALAEPLKARAARQQAMGDVVARTSWEDTAARMKRLIEGAAAWRTAGTSAVESEAPAPPSIRPAAPARPRRPREYQAIVIGAGPTGLSAGYHLGEGSLVLEQNERVGGWCRSVTTRGFTFDHAGHIMFSNDPYVHSLYGKLLGDNVHWQDREAWIYSKQTYSRYPFQGALYGLPPDVIKDCIVGAIEARFGALKAPVPAAADGAQAMRADCCADGVVPASRVFGGQSLAVSPADGKADNFEQFIYRVWGKGIAKHFAVPYNTKLWGVPLAEMETSWLGGRVPLPDLEEMIEGALSPVPKPQGPNARFGYPLRGGFQAMMDGFLPLLRGELLTNARVTSIDPNHRRVELADGRTFGYERLVSTAPLPVLARLLGNALPRSLHAAASRLRHVSVRCVNLGVGRENVTDKHWIYYPENTIFHRIFAQSNASPHCSPPGTSGLVCEITYSGSKPLPCDGDELIDRCIADCIDVGMLRPDDEIQARQLIDMPYAYVIYDRARANNVAALRQWLQQAGIILAGRYAEWEYYNSDHAFLAGKRAAEQVTAASGGATAEMLTSA